MDPIVDEGFYREEIQFLLDWQNGGARQVIKAGATALKLGQHATSCVGPEYFQRYVRDYEKRDGAPDSRRGRQRCTQLWRRATHHATSTTIWKSTCGVTSLPPFGDVNLDDALRIIRPSMTLRGKH